MSTPREHSHVPTAAPGAEPVPLALSTMQLAIAARENVSAPREHPHVPTAAPGAEPVTHALSTMQLAIAAKENVSAPREHPHVPTAAPGAEPVSATLSMIQSLKMEEPSPLQPTSRRESNGNEETSSRGRMDNPTVENHAQVDRYESRFEGHKATLEETYEVACGHKLL